MWALRVNAHNPEEGHPHNKEVELLHLRDPSQSLARICNSWLKWVKDLGHPANSANLRLHESHSLVDTTLQIGILTISQIKELQEWQQLLTISLKGESHQLLVLAAQDLTRKTGSICRWRRASRFSRVQVLLANQHQYQRDLLHHMLPLTASMLNQFHFKYRIKSKTQNNKFKNSMCQGMRIWSEIWTSSSTYSFRKLWER